ncbi:hypothetical protein [Mesorhizobium sp. M4A.F.Ca.ET.020.02.1.1]|nr:hypothetical protein [Mesorhizobium sp. M4A.F.Ca.ET.020.02.1.1]
MLATRAYGTWGTGFATLTTRTRFARCTGGAITTGRTGFTSLA